MAHQTSRKPASLSKLYDAKMLVCDKIAACIAIDARLEQEFDTSIDRERIDPALRSVLVLASVSLSEVSLAKRICRTIGYRYYFDLISLVDPLHPSGNLALVGLYGWYQEELRRLLAAEALAERAAELRLEAAKELQSVLATAGKIRESI